MSQMMTLRHHAPVRSKPACDLEATVVSTSEATEIYARCAPFASGTSKNGCLAQSEILYEGLAALLGQLGADMSHVVMEKAYFRALATDCSDFRQIRAETYRHFGIVGETLPGITYLGQAPCRPGQDIELQAYAVVPSLEGTVRVQSLHSPQESMQVKLIEIGKARHLYVANATAQFPGRTRPKSLREQSDRIFQTLREVVEGQGISFRDVLRTWVYLDNIDRDYADLNASRNAFFEREGVRRLPASTDIGGGSYLPGSLGAIDLYALVNPEIAQIEIMKTPTPSEACECGSAFARGMKMALGEQTHLFISGTASVDEAGATVHPGDVRAQIERMHLNIEELLRAQNATFGDLVHAVSYLKSCEHVDLLREILAERGITEVPHTIVEANVCRPELLCEMEAIAIVPSR